MKRLNTIIVLSLIGFSLTGPLHADSETASKTSNTTQTQGNSYMNFDIKDKEKAVVQLTAEQRRVTQNEGTEPPFKNAYWDSKEPGLYVDIVSGEPLFLSIHKYDSGTGWPSFTQPVSPTSVSLHEDKGLFWSTRTEVRSKIADSHLGHVFDDGPQPTGKRYCMNSASMRFIPKDQLAAEGFEEYLKWFK